MASGVKHTDDCVQKYNDLKLNHKFRYIVYNITSESQIEVEKTADASATYDDFIKELPKDEPRYAVFDFEFDAGEGTRNKLVFVNWSPDTAKIKSKMVYASSKNEFKKALVGLAIEIQATDAAEADYETVLEKCKAFA
eukprot:gb/GECH01011351.1/.p1 GENE.gb/GECH01011351.1/~~gb/GECH01011351.1/.p1  ORF type:complete len:138 (+),score=24.56 gb/GECH01011351.1/:1-414(+)